MADFKEARGAKATPEHDVIDEAIQAGGDGYTVFSIVGGEILWPEDGLADA